MVVNIVEHPQDARYRRIKMQNALFRSLPPGSLPGAIDCMLVLGFRQQTVGDEQVGAAPSQSHTLICMCMSEGASCRRRKRGSNPR
jgi:PUB domain